MWRYLGLAAYGIMHIVGGHSFSFLFFGVGGKEESQEVLYTSKRHTSKGQYLMQHSECIPFENIHIL